MVKSKEDKPLEKVSKIKEGKTKAKEKAGKCNTVELLKKAMKKNKKEAK